MKNPFFVVRDFYSNKSSNKKNIQSKIWVQPRKNQLLKNKRYKIKSNISRKKENKISSLLKALTMIASDTDSNSFKQMLEILNSTGKIINEKNRGKKVNLREIDDTSLFRLKKLVERHILVNKKLQ